MEDFYNSSLIQSIKDKIKTNNNKGITGNILQEELLKIVSALDLGGMFLGFASESTNPTNEGKSRANGFYFSTEEGTYTNFIGSNNQPLVIGSDLEIIYREVINDTLTWNHRSIASQFSVSGEEGNFASFDANGDLEDSGKNAGSFAAVLVVNDIEQLTSEQVEGLKVGDVVSARVFETTTQEYENYTVESKSQTTCILVLHLRTSNVEAIYSKSNNTWSFVYRRIMSFEDLADIDLSNLSGEGEEKFDAKADKVSEATSGNFAGLDANGNLTDSGYKAADFVQNITRGGSTLTKTNGIVDIPEEIENVVATPVAAGGNPTVNLTNGILTLGLPSGANGQNGADAYNPFKGTYLITDTPPTTGQDGDYIYVVDSQTPPVTHLYTWDGSAFSDTLETVTIGDSQFANSTKLISQTNVVNNLISGGTEDVLSAEQGKVLVQRLSLIQQPTEETNLKSDVVWLEGFYYINAAGSLVEHTGTYKTTDYINLPSDVKTINYKGGTATTSTYKQVAVYNNSNECLGTFFQYPAADGVSFDISNLVGATKMRISEYDVRINNNTWDISVGVEVIHTNQEVFEDFTQSVDDRFDEVDEQFNNLDTNYYLADPVDTETNLKSDVVWLEGYYYINADGTLQSASSVGKVSDYIDLLPNTKAIRYKGGVDVNEPHKQVAIYNSERTGLATFRIRPVQEGGNVFDITDYPTAVKMRICEWQQYITQNSWDISVIHPVRETNKETFDDFVGWVDSLNQWKGKRFIGFGASTTSSGFSDGNSYLQIAAEKLKMLPPLNGFASRRVSLKYVDGSLNLVGLAATITECQSIDASTTISYETQFAKDFDCVLFGTFAGESYEESQVVIDGTTYYGGEELIDLVKLPTTRYNNNPQFTYSNGDTLTQHRDSYIGAVIYLLNELWTRKPTCRVVFTYSFLQWNDYSYWDKNRKGIKKLCEKLHLPFLDLSESVYFNGFTTGIGAEEDRTNPNIFLYDGQHPSLAGRQRLGNIFTHKLLLVS